MPEYHTVVQSREWDSVITEIQIDVSCSMCRNITQLCSHVSEILLSQRYRYIYPAPCAGISHSCAVMWVRFCYHRGTDRCILFHVQEYHTVVQSHKWDSIITEIQIDVSCSMCQNITQWYLYSDMRFCYHRDTNRCILLHVSCKWDSIITEIHTDVSCSMCWNITQLCSHLSEILLYLRYR